LGFYKNLQSFISEYKHSRNRLYFMQKYKLYITAFLAIVGFILGFIGFLFLGFSVVVSAIKALKLFSLDYPDEENIFLLLSIVFITVTLFSAALFTFFKDFINKKIAKKIIQTKHIAVFGLGEINQAFLNSNLTNENIIIFEANKNNIYIEEYQEKGFGVIIGDILSLRQFNLLNYKNMEYALIALGDDRANIELAIQMINAIKQQEEKTPTRLIIHIANSKLKTIFHQNFLLSSLDEPMIDIKTFSFYEECAEDLFLKHSLIRKEFIHSDKELKSIILGNGSLALAIIKNVLLLSNFPNNNKHTIYLIDKEAEIFYEKLRLLTNYTQDKFPTIQFKVINKDYNSVSFYQEKIFMDNNLNNIYICYDDESVNLDLAIILNEKIYIKQRFLNINVLFAIFKETTLSNLLDESDKSFKNFYTFGSKNKIFAYNRLIEEDNYKIAKMIHHGYGDEFDKDMLLSNDKLNKKWFKQSAYSDKLSSIAQAKHIDMKLLALDLKRTKSDLSKEELLKQNRAKFDAKIEPFMKEVNFNYNTLYRYSLELAKLWAGKKYNVMYKPKISDNLFEKLIFCEHNRWNSFHYLQGWVYHIKKDKDLKQHNCLKPLELFNEDHLLITIIYDIYAIVYIPNYLANSGWAIIDA